MIGTTAEGSCAKSDFQLSQWGKWEDMSPFKQERKKKKCRTDLIFPNMILIVLHFLKIDHAELSLSLAR